MALSDEESAGLAALEKLLDDTLLPHNLLVQYLLSSRNDPKKAADRATSFIQANKDLVLLSATIDEPEISAELGSGKLFSNENVIFFRPRLHNPATTSVRKLLRAMWVLVRGSLDSDERIVRDGVIFVIDLQGVHSSQIPRSHVRGLLTLLNKTLPLRVVAEVVVDMPLWMKTLYTFARPFLSAKTTARLGFTQRSQILRQGNSATVKIGNGSMIPLPSSCRPLDMHGEFNFDAQKFVKSFYETDGLKKVGMHMDSHSEAIPTLHAAEPILPPMHDENEREVKSVPSNSNDATKNEEAHVREYAFFKSLVEEEKRKEEKKEKASKEILAAMTVEEREEYDRNEAERRKHEQTKEKLLTSSHLGQYKTAGLKNKMAERGRGRGRRGKGNRQKKSES